MMTIILLMYRKKRQDPAPAEIEDQGHIRQEIEKGHPSAGYYQRLPQSDLKCHYTFSKSKYGTQCIKLTVNVGESRQG